MKARLVLLVLLSAVGFYNPLDKISDPITKVMLFLSIIFASVYAYYNGTDLSQTKYPRKSILVILASILVSAVMASAFHMQKITASVITVLPTFFAYAFFLTLMKLDAAPKKIMQGMIILSFVSGIVYFANLATFPSNIFGKPILNDDTSRGILRVQVVFSDFLPVLAVYALNRFRITGKKKWLVYLGYVIMMVVLSVIRQLILYTTFLCLLMYLKRASWKVRIVTVVLSISAATALFMTPIFQAMVEVSENQVEANEDEENIRITSWRYYTYEKQTNALSFLLGNGIPSFGVSRWGQEFDSETEDNGCFAADVGWAGFYWHFGIFATIALLYMIIKTFTLRYTDDMAFVPYAAGYYLLAGIASGSNLYFYQIVLIMTVLYMAYRKGDTVSETEPQTPELPQEQADAPYLPQLGQGPLLPQLDREGEA